MKLRHAAALALTGWYLLANGGSDVPLRRWAHLGSYDSAKECTEDQNRMIAKTYQSDYRPPSGFTVEKTRHFLIVSECIASDDPRLAK
jgi:hypothetical protein